MAYVFVVLGPAKGRYWI